MSNFYCGWCGHNGIHAEHIPTDATIQRCTQCERCLAQMAGERKQK